MKGPCLNIAVVNGILQPEGMTRDDIIHMSDNDLLDMDYFLHDEDSDDDFGEPGFYIF